MEWRAVGPFGPNFSADVEGTRTCRGLDLELPACGYTFEEASLHCAHIIAVYCPDNGESAEIVALGPQSSHGDVGERASVSGQFEGEHVADWGAERCTNGGQLAGAVVAGMVAGRIDLAAGCIVLGWRG